MLNIIDGYLNKITMYRLTWYLLLFLLAIAFGLSLFGLLAFNPLYLAFSTLFLFLACFGINKIFAYFYRAPSNAESVYITAFILALIITPPTTLSQMLFLLWASFFAIASKYALAITKKHLFNPAAFAVALTALTLNQYASWWVGTLYMAPFVLVVGFLIARKIKRWDLVLTFFATAIILVVGNAFLSHQNVLFIAKALIIDSPLLFFAFIMLTEPATTPPTKSKRMWYGALVGILYAPFVNIFGFYFSPELALLAGNIFSYIASPKEKLILMLKEKITIAADTYDFVFHPNQKLAFQPGQYLEWTLAQPHPDNRGIRRYFTIASSPTEEDIRIGVKFYPKPSSYKTALQSLGTKNTIVASQLAGDFTMPSDTKQKLVFIAGGIGVTPFRSMIKYLLDTDGLGLPDAGSDSFFLIWATALRKFFDRILRICLKIFSLPRQQIEKEIIQKHPVIQGQKKRDIVIFYANGSYADIAYKEIFDQAQQKLGIKTIYALGETKTCPPHFNCEEGYLGKDVLIKNVPDYKERLFYISGPHSMIMAFETTLKDMGIPKHQIKTDYFPGFA